MDRIHFPYRSNVHLPLLHVIAESGSWERHGLDVIYDVKITSSDAHRDVPTGDIEFVGGNHVSTYGHRARGDSWVYLGQTVNLLRHKLIVRPDSGITKLADLKKKTVGSVGKHPGLNVWLYLKQHGLDADRDEVGLVKPDQIMRNGKPLTEGPDGGNVLVDMVQNRDCDAALVWSPASDFAVRAGLSVIDIDPMPMIWFTTISSSMGFVEKHPELVERFIKGLLEGVAFFKTQPEKAIKIIQERYDAEGSLDLELARKLHADIEAMIEPRLFPSLDAISNVYQEAIRQDKDAAKVNPMELWDLHALRRIDDSGFIDQLYKGSSRAAGAGAR
jgi:ABC-type nitrate/sulfonate/bicarbonate transport system substrate-binding protein